MKKLITILILTFWAIYSCAEIQNDTICHGDSVLFHGKYYNVSGIYSDSVQVIDHIDTVAIDTIVIDSVAYYEFTLDTFYRDSITDILVLTVMPNTIKYRQVNLCNGDVYTYNGIQYTTSAIFDDTLHSRFGCDSIIRISVNFHPSHFISTRHSICSGAVYKFGNRRLTEPGVYYDSLQTIHGCDSIIELTLTVNPSFSYEIFDTICQGDSYSWFGNNYTHSGKYIEQFTTVDGCDSTYFLYLEVLPEILHTTDKEICQGEFYVFRGQKYTSQGIYDDTVFAAGACDTIYRLNLTVNQHVRLTIDTTICSNDIFSLNRKTYDRAGTYLDTLPGINGDCDTFAVIQLSVLPVPDTTISHGICKESSFYYRDRLIDKPGVYIDTFVAMNGCDSIVRLVVNENPSYLLEDTVYICEGDSNIFFDQILINKGTYTAYLKTKDGCDSIFERTVIVNKKDTITRNVHRCDHQPYNFFGQLITLPGTYQKLFTNRFGCDSLIILNYDTTPYFYQEYAHICEGETYDFHGKIVSTQGTHFAQFTGKYDCDSTYRLYLTVGKQYEFVTDTAVCDGTPFFWRGKQYVQSGTYMDSFASHLGCDSVYVLNLTFLDRPHYNKVVEFCQGDSLFFNGQVIKHSTNIDDTLRSISGCDSIVHYRFNMLPSFHHSDTVDICIGSSYQWHGQAINRSGLYWDSLKTKNGCDSIFELTVRAVHSQTFPLSATICNGEYYDFNGKHLYSTGIYYDTIYNSQGCADIFILDLKVNPTYISTSRITLCSDEGFWHNGVYIDKAGIYYDSLKSVDGCDSICRIVVNRAARYFFSDTVRIYQGASYNFHGHTLQIAGTYYDSLKTISGCDSIFQLILQVTPEFHHVEYATICDNEYYDFHGRMLNVPGTYWDSLKTFNNFDSVYELHLTVNPSYLITSEFTECYGNTIHFRGKHITKPGIYYDSLYSINGCDSVYRLIFNWSNTFLFEDTAIICQGDFHTFRGRRLSNDGVYYDSLKTQDGCDSIYKLRLIVQHPFYAETTDTMCEGDVYDFHGRMLTEPGVYYDSTKSVYGCDSVYKLTLSKFPSYEFSTFIEECYGHKWIYRGINIDKPGIYYDSLVSTTGCDSVYKLVYSWSSDYHFYDTVNICEGDYYNFRGRNVYLAGNYYDSLTTTKGCDSIFQLYLNVVKSFHDLQIVNTCSNEYYDFRGTLLNKSGTYFDSLKSSYGCDSVYELRLSISPEHLLTDYIEICQGASYQYKGITITKPGVYYDSLKTRFGCDSVTKIIVNYSPRYLFVDTASLCAGGTYLWRGKGYSLAGNYYDSLRTQRGCDSIFKLVLRIVQPFHNIQHVEICSNETYNFRGRYINQSGIYYDSLKNSQGCDSVYELHLRIKPHYTFDNFIEVCYGNPVTFRGKHITKPGIYYDSLLTHDGCDSIYRLIFTWKSNYFFSDTAVICNGGYYNFHGKTISKSGYYYDSLHTHDGCDSIYQLVLIVNPASSTVVDTTLCSNDVFRLHGKRITSSGTYYDTIRSTLGCDSFITYNVTIHDSYLNETHTTLCHGSDIFFRGIHITKPGVYYDSMRSIYGCDSVYKMVFNWTPTYLFIDTVRLCNGGSYNFHGRRIRGAGIYYDSLRTVAGCDSVYKLVVFTGNGYYHEETLNICSNDVYFFNGRRITQSGVYWDSLSTINGCDSVFKLTITVDSSKTTNIHADICSNDIYYRPDGTVINKTGLYIDTLVTSAGCDSIVRLALNVHADKFYEEDKTICKGNYYSWHGRNLTSSGIYWDSLVTSAGCDSIFKLNLTNNTYYTEIDTTLCNNTVFRFNNRNYTSSGIYYDTLVTVLGCDSVFKINLTINPTYNIVRHLTICDTDYPIPFAGGFVNQTGVYTDTSVTLQGCDSINTLYLTVVQTYYFMEDTICEDEIYSWRGHQYTQPGLYTDTVRGQTEALCDIIYALRLHTVQKTNLYSLDIAPYICADDIEYSIAPRYTGSKPDAYTVRYTSAEISKQSDIVNANFTTSPILVPLPLSVDGDSLRPDTYTGTLEVFNRVCDANPLSLNFTLNIRYPSYIVNQHWNDVVAILNSKYNGGYTFSKYDWYVNGILIQSITGSNMFLPNLRTGDKVEVGLTREGESYAVLTCPIWMQDLSNLEVSEYPVAVEGTILRNNTQAHIIASAAGTYGLYSAAGLLITSGTFDKDSETLVTLPAVSGIYFLRVTSNNEPRTFKLMVQ